MRDPDLRRCTHAEVGVWFRILCLMFESEFKGMLATNGEPWTDEEIALAVGGDKIETKRCVTALVTKGVASRNERGALINRRMYREHLERVAIRERVRQFRGRQCGNGDVTEEETPTVTEEKRESTTRVRAETETEAEATTTTPHKSNQAEIPDWIPQDSWKGFIENRKALRSPMTPRAVTMIVRQLESFRDSGQDPGAILDQSTTNGWKGVFELKHGGTQHGATRPNNQGAAVGRVQRSGAGYGAVAERRIVEAARANASADVGGVPASGGGTRDGGDILRDLRGSGARVRDAESRDGDAMVSEQADIFPPPVRSPRGA